MMPNIRLYYEFNVLKMWMIILEYARVRMLFSRLTVYFCHKCGTYTLTHIRIRIRIHTLMKRKRIFMVNWMHVANWIRTSRYILSLFLRRYSKMLLFCPSSSTLFLYLYIHFSASSISLMLTCVWVSIYTWIAKMLSGTIVNVFHICTACILLRASFIFFVCVCVCVCGRDGAKFLAWKGRIGVETEKKKTKKKKIIRI